MYTNYGLPWFDSFYSSHNKFELDNDSGHNRFDLDEKYSGKNNNKFDSDHD